jgi:uncharacterized protein YjbI with pentapeptide repeats
MANPEHFALLRQGVSVWNEWKSKTTERVDLSETAFSDMDLRGIDFRNVDLCMACFVRARVDGAEFFNTDLREAIFSDTNLTQANLTQADLSGAYLIDAVLTMAILTEADLTGADLRGANLRGSNLAETDLTEVALEGTAFDDVDLSTTKGLESAIHLGPSSIGIDTLYHSTGQIPEIFLRGCGVPDSFITQAKALIGAEEGIQFYSCFISYSTKDEEFARRLHARLQQEHIRVWFAPHDMKSGEKLHEQIDTAIKVYDKLLILLSPDSLQSKWVMTELRKARKAEGKTGKRKLFPMRLVDYPTLTDWECFDSDSGTDLATEVREYFIPDFSNWKNHDAFEAAFARLLKDLRQSTQPAPLS